MKKSNLIIYTSFMSPENYKKLISENILPIFIIRNLKSSEFLRKFQNSSVHFKELAPENKLFQDRRDNKISDLEYKRQYILQISNLDFQTIINKFEKLSDISGSSSIVLLDYGRQPEIPTHRKILGELLNESGLLNNKIKEYDNNDYLY